MDFWSNLSNLYNLRKTVNTSSDNTAINNAKNEEKELLSKSNLFDINNDNKVDIEDLICFSKTQEKDLDNVDGITEDEKQFLSDMKEALYDKLAKDINKKEEIKIEDMLSLEERAKNMSEEEKTSAGGFVEKLQNRMVSKLTAQFFVTKETESYKQNAINGAIEIWEAQNKIDEWKVSDENPFNDKFENLLNKLEGRVTRTLAEEYTEESIKDAKNLKSADALVKKSDSSEGDGEEEDYDKSKFSFESNILYYDGNKFTGTYGNKYYQNGEVLTGVAYKNGFYYEAGALGNGAYPNINGSSTIGTFWVIDGKILYQDKVDTANNTVRTYYDSYIIKDSQGTTTKDAVINQVITFDGSIETGKLDSTVNFKTLVQYKNGEIETTDTYAYNADGSYSIKREYADTQKETEYLMYTTNGSIFDGNGVYDGKLYENNALKQGDAEYGGRYYVDGVLASGTKVYNGTLYVNGEKLTGISSVDGKYYVEGKILESTTVNGKLYRYGVLAQGVIKEENKYNYYVNGEKVSEADSKIGKFIVEHFIENVVFEKENNEYDYSSFKGMQYVDGSWRSVEYNVTDENNFTLTVSYESDIKLVNTYENGTLTSAKYNLKGTMVNVNVNGNKSDTGIDYSLQYTDVDGCHNTVLINNAIGDNLTYVYKYELKNGSYNLTETKLVIGSINDLQSGKLLTQYNLSDEDSKITYVEIKDDNNNVSGVKVTDESLNGVKIEQTFELDGKVKEGKVIFNNPSENGVSTITINEGEICKVNNDKVVISVPQKDESGNIVNFTVTTYNIDGTKDGEPVVINDADGTKKSFAEKININLEDLQNIELEDGKVTKIKLEGIEYAVTYNNETIILKSGDNIEKQFLNNVVIYEKSPSFAGVVTIERTQSGVQKLYKVEFDENSFTEYNYDEQTGKLIKEIYKTADEQKAIEYAPDGKTVKSTEVTQYEDGNVKSVKIYAGEIADDAVSYEKSVDETGYVEVFYDITTGKKSEERILSEAVAASGTEAAEPKTLTVKTYKADGTTVASTTITTYSSTDKIDTIVKKDENDKEIQKTQYTDDGYTVESYTYENSVDSKTQTTKDTYKNGIITETTVIDNANGNKLSKRIAYENGLKYIVETVSEYDNNGKPKTSLVEEYRGGNIRVRVLNRTYTDYDNNKFTDKVNDEITEVGGVKVQEAQLNFAKTIGLTITDIEYNEDGSLKTLVGTRFNDARICNYTNWSVNSAGEYTYLEEITLAGNETASTDDDVTYYTSVENNIQKYARIKISGNTYPVNVNGAEVNDKLDVSIGTERVNDTAKYVTVSDVLFDGLVRKRVFTLNETTAKYELTNYVSIGTLDDATDSTKSVPSILIPTGKEITVSADNKTVIIPANDNKVPVYINGTKKYDIELQEGETFEIVKDDNGIKVQSKKDNTVTASYVFGDDDNICTITQKLNNDVILTKTVDKDGNYSSIKINGTELITFDNVAETTVEVDENNVTVTAKDATTNVEQIYKIALNKNTSNNVNAGDIVERKLKFANNTEIVLSKTDTLTVADGKITVQSENSKISDTYNAEGTRIALKIDSTTFNLSEVEVSYNTDKTEITVKRNNSTTKPNFEIVYSVADGKIKSGKLTKNSTTLTISADSVFAEDENGYISVQSGNELFIYNSSLDELNAKLGLTYAEYISLNDALKSYNTSLAADKQIKLDNVKSADVSSTDVSFELKNNQICTETIFYKIANSSITKTYTIGKQVFTVPKTATITSANGTITISYTTGSTTKTIVLSKSETSATYYDRIKYDNGDAQEFDEEASVTINNDGTIDE